MSVIAAVAGAHLVLGGRDRRPTHEVGDVPALLVGGHRHHDAGGTGARRATGAVQVGLVLGRRVDVHDEGDVVDVDAARGDVGGHQDPDVTVGERREVALAGGLAEVAVQVDGVDARRRERARPALGLVLGAGEGQRAALAADQLGDDLAAVGGVDVEDVVVHRGHRRRGRVDLVGDRVVQVAAGQDVDAGVQRRGEQQSLAVGRGLVEQAAHLGQEAEIGHVVGLVDDGDDDVLEAGTAAA